MAFGAPGLALGGAPAAGGPLRVGVDRDLSESGLAAAFKRSFAADTGIAVKLVASPALVVLEAVRNGEVDVAITNAPVAEAALESQGLVHDRHLIASGEFIVVGPAPRGRARPTATASGGAVWLAWVREAAAAGPGSAVFLSAGDGSGSHDAEQALWRAARIAPMPPWYVTAEAGRPFLAQVRARSAFAVVERGAWVALGGAPLSVLVEADPSLTESVHVMRSFRVSHPAGRIFVAWLAGRRGRSVVAAQRGYRVDAA